MKQGMLLMILLLFASTIFSTQNDYSIAEKLIIEEMSQELSEMAFQSFKAIPQTKLNGSDGRPIKGCAILPIPNDIEDVFYNLLKSKFTKVDLNFYERKEIDRIIAEQGLQSVDFYSNDGRLKIGKLKQWKGIIVGELNSKIESKFGKKKIYLELAIDMNNLETGQVIWSENFKTYKKSEYPIIIYLIGMGLFFVLGIFLNAVSKGRKTSFILSLFFVLMILYSIWYFVM